MLSILRKARSSSSSWTTAKPTVSSPAEGYLNGDDDLSTWELVNPSDDDEDLFSFEGGDDDASTDEDGVITEQEKERDDEEDENTPGRGDVVPLKDVMAIESLSVSPPSTFPVEVTRHHEEAYGYDENYDDDDEDEDEDEDEDDDVDDGIDDDLVPWKLKDRFGKQRLKKMGKRGMGPKFTNKTKRVPHYYYKKPGYVYARPGSMHLTYI